MDPNIPFNRDHHSLQTPVREPLLFTPTTTEPKSEYLRQMLRERREDLGMSDQSFRHLSLSEPKPARGLDDYIFESEEDKKKSRRKPRGPASRISSATSQHAGQRPSRTQSYSMGNREQHKDMDKMSKDNFDLKLRLTLVEERSHRLEADLEEALDKIDSLRGIEEEREELHEENVSLYDQVEELQQSKEACEQKLRDSWKMNGEVFAELEKRDAAIKEALDMYLDSERRMQSLEAELAKYKAGPRRRDSSYFSTGQESTLTRSNEECSRPSTSHTGAQRGGYASAPASPERQDALPELAPSLPINPRYSRLVRTVSVGEIRANDLRERASTANGPEFAIDDIRSSHSSPVQRRRTLRRSSGSPQLDRASIKTTSSNRSRGLRSVYLGKEREGPSPAFSESIRAPSDMSNESDHDIGQHLTVATPRRFAGRLCSTASSSPLGSFHDCGDEIDSMPDSDQLEGTVMNDENKDTRSEVTQFEEEEFTTPTTSEAPSIPTDFRPGQYPQWPNAGGKFGLGRNTFFHGERVDDVPRGRR